MINLRPNKRNKQGFTLVELSIVMVIVGLLIGGVLMAQSLIESSQINAQAQQIQQFDAGVMSFKSKYKYLPGDAPAFGGDGNNAIEGLNSKTGWGGNVTVHLGEVSNFWAQLFPGKYAPGTYTTGGTQVIDTVIIIGANKTSPVPKIGRKNSAIIATTHGSGGVSSANNTDNYYTIVNLDNSWTDGFYRFANSVNGNRAYKAIELQALDKKIDDGLANSGYVLSGSWVTGWGAPALTPYNNCSSGSGYLINNNTYQCSPFIRIGGGAGNPL
jgi:prepilin-type N-terminal cleavage/methylation domain-containing protein